MKVVSTRFEKSLEGPVEVSSCQEVATIPSRVRAYRSLNSTMLSQAGGFLRFCGAVAALGEPSPC